MTTSNFYIHYVLYPLRHFGGVYNTTTIGEASFKKWPCYIVSNLSPEGALGSHWIGIALFREEVFYFDPLGKKCQPPDILDYLSTQGYTSYKYLKKNIQHIFSHHCGYFVMAFFIFLDAGGTISDFLSMFPSSSRDNDLVVQTIVESYEKKN